MAASAFASGRRRPWRALLLPAAAFACLACLAASGAFAAAPGLRPEARGRRPLRSRVQRYAATDTFDPWTALGIAPNAGEAEARKAYKQIIRKFHPDLDPSPEAAKKFQDAVRAQAIISGEDRKMDESTLLKNAVENLRNDMEFKRQNIEKLKAEAAAEEQSMKEMEKQMIAAQQKRDEVTTELGLAGGATLGLVLGLGVSFVGVPAGVVLGSLAGIAVKDNDDAFGNMVRAIGTVTKGLVNKAGEQATK